MTGNGAVDLIAPDGSLIEPAAGSRSRDRERQFHDVSRQADLVAGRRRLVRESYSA